MSNIPHRTVLRALSPETTPRQKTVSVFIVVAILGFSYAFNGLDRSVFPALLGPISKELDLNPAQGGFLANIFTLNIGIFGALSGWFMGRFGRKRTLIAGLVFYSLFTILIPLAQSYRELALYRAMTGAGEALHIAAIFAMIGAYFGNRRGTFIGINNAFFGVGTFLAPLIATRMFAVLGSSELFVEGSLRQSKWKDRETGKDRQTLFVRVDGWQFTQHLEKAPEQEVER